VAAGDCVALPGRIRCANADGSVRALFVAAPDGTRWRFALRLRRFEMARDQAGPLTVTIRHGDVDRVGANATCRVYPGKIVCRDR